MYHPKVDGFAFCIFRFSFFVFRALAHCLIYAAVVGLQHQSIIAHRRSDSNCFGGLRKWAGQPVLREHSHFGITVCRKPDSNDTRICLKHP